MDDNINSLCFCGSKLSFEHCCLRFISQQQLPQTAELLMRSRYSAYVTHNADYLIQTWRTQYHDKNLHQQLVEGFTNTKWLGLNIISSSNGKNSDEAYIEFSACFIRQKVDHKQLIHERSRFLRFNQQWFYIDGVTPRIARNDHCPCGSAKKYKRCCGNN